MDTSNNLHMICYLKVRYLNVAVAKNVVNKPKEEREMDLKKQSGLKPNNTFSSFIMISSCVSKSMHSSTE